MNTKLQGLIGGVVGVAAVAAAGFGVMHFSGPKSGDDIVQRWHDQTFGKVYRELLEEVQDRPQKSEILYSFDFATDVDVEMEASVDAVIQSDLTGEEGKMKMTLDFAVDAAMEEGSEERMEGVATVMGMGDTFYASLTELTADTTPEVQAMVDEVVMPYVGQWFMAENEVFAQMLSNTQEYDQLFMEEAGNVVKALNVWTTSNFEKSGGEYAFDIEMDKEKLRTLGLAVIDFQLAMLETDTISSDEEKDMMREGLEAQRKEIQEDTMEEFVSFIKGRMTLSKKGNGFKFDGVIQDAEMDYTYDEEAGSFYSEFKGVDEIGTLEVEYKEDVLTLVAANADMPEEMLSCEYKEEAYNCEMQGATVVSGEVSEKEFTLEIPMLDVSVEIEETGKDEYMVMVDTPEFTVDMDRLFVAKNGRKVEASMAISQSGVELGSGGFSLERKALSAPIEIEVPEDATDMSAEVEEMLNGDPMAASMFMDQGMSEDPYMDESMDMYMDEMTEEDMQAMMQMMEEFEAMEMEAMEDVETSAVE